MTDDEFIHLRRQAPDDVEILIAQRPAALDGAGPRVGSVSLEERHLEIARQKHLWFEALYRSQLPASAIRVGLCLVVKFLNTRTGALYPSLSLVGDECGLPEGTVKDGIKALKRARLLLTKKKRFDGTPDYFLALPDDARTDENPSIRADCERMKIHPSNRWESIRRTDENPSINLRTEPKNGTSEHSGRGHEPGGDRFAGPSAVPPFGRNPPSRSSEPLTVDETIRFEGRTV